MHGRVAPWLVSNNWSTVAASLSAARHKRKASGSREASSWSAAEGLRSRNLLIRRQTKPALAPALITRASREGPRSGWPATRSTALTQTVAAIRSHGLDYVLAVAANRRVHRRGRPDPRRWDPGDVARISVAETQRRCRQPPSRIYSGAGSS